MKKEILIPLVIMILGLIFVIINIFVFFSKGNAWFIKKKLKIGALILTFTSIAACHTIHQPTCYDVTAVEPTENMDSIANAKRQDSIKMAQKHINDSIANANNEQRKKDSIAKIKPVKGDSIIPTCYKAPPPKTCYAPPRNQKEN